MDIQKINRRHFVETDLYYRVSLGLSSKLLRYENGIFHLEVTLGRKWDKNYNATAAEIAHAWKTNHPELAHALGCKVFITDLKTGENKTMLIQAGIAPGYDAYKGILFRKNYLN
ncbi:MAG: hypothetical protein IPL08_18560 [Saprospiraceae bacterium]|jgi:hypothetical protein|nr:hypothetical protein [Saprospiraceae bacterium]MBK8670302.1 hypothetical protein [Saprospiraceae bacterium]